MGGVLRGIDFEGTVGFVRIERLTGNIDKRYLSRVSGVCWDEL
jgi:hypothetical protein